VNCRKNSESYVVSGFVSAVAHFFSSAGVVSAGFFCGVATSVFDSVAVALASSGFRSVVIVLFTTPNVIVPVSFQRLFFVL
jgi:hypothetical protein